MIEINLVPRNLRKRKTSTGNIAASKLNIPKEALVGLCGGLFVLLVAVVIVLQLLIFIKYAQHKKLKTQWDEILPSKTATDAVVSKLRSLRLKSKSVENILVKKEISWAKKLNEISDNLPRGVWLRRIVFDQNAFLIEGSAVSKGQNEMINVHQFAANLKAKEGFLENLTDFELGAIQGRKIKTIDVADFTIKAKVK
ncbi:MAG: hypothetical protein A2Z88_03220 [Omnitrophica WOR_2 bacterium GWA2_47_8]|nr:MAG: hypothetical protein A2Z88_03220 [Omnitrophica WOR_2 bacterium GWA2_47_8]